MRIAESGTSSIVTGAWARVRPSSGRYTVSPQRSRATAGLRGSAGLLMTFGGNQSELGRRFIARIREEIDRRAFAVLVQRLEIDYAALGGDAGYIGAAGIARAEHLGGK